MKGLVPVVVKENAQKTVRTIVQVIAHEIVPQIIVLTVVLVHAQTAAVTAAVPAVVHLVMTIVQHLAVVSKQYAPNYYFHCHSRLPAEVQILLSRWEEPSGRDVGRNRTSSGGLCLATPDRLQY